MCQRGQRTKVIVRGIAFVIFQEIPGCQTILCVVNYFSNSFQNLTGNVHCSKLEKKSCSSHIRFEDILFFRVALRKINTKLQFLNRQNEFLNPKLSRLLCNSLIQPHFSYDCISWYPLIIQKMRNKLQVNECIRFLFKTHLKATYRD